MLSYIKISYILYSVGSALFASDGGYFSTGLATSVPVYVKVHNNFAPIRYFIIGFDSISLTDKLFSLNMNIDQDMIISVTTANTNKIPIIKIIYLAIGNKMSEVCSKCSTSSSDKHYAYGDTCVRVCPVNTYAYDMYSNGGQSCLTCSTKLNQSLNSLKTACVCLPGYTRTSTGLCLASANMNGTLNNAASLILIGNNIENNNSITNINNNTSFSNKTSKSLLVADIVSTAAPPPTTTNLLSNNISTSLSKIDTNTSKISKLT